MAQVLEYLDKQQAQASALVLAPSIIPSLELTPHSPDVPEPDVSMADEDQDVISIAAFWEGGSFQQKEEEEQVPYL
ncbi:hypothetical protein EOD39_14283 [Acipenser ruthenus]|uniref:Uncharacterized protein n=1 Tax=Acipenser ruthenus TaxID=7906 RepID=A0A662YM69_ACIRT|nr:hypothetical protein EOD39_14283 [Acipenser ruthenus]